MEVPANIGGAACAPLSPLVPSPPASPESQSVPVASPESQSVIDYAAPTGTPKQPSDDDDDDEDDGTTDDDNDATTDVDEETLSFDDNNMPKEKGDRELDAVEKVDREPDVEVMLKHNVFENFMSTSTVQGVAVAKCKFVPAFDPEGASQEENNRPLRNNSDKHYPRSSCKVSDATFQEKGVRSRFGTCTCGMMVKKSARDLCKANGCTNYFCGKCKRSYKTWGAHSKK